MIRIHPYIMVSCKGSVNLQSETQFILRYIYLTGIRTSGLTQCRIQSSSIALYSVQEGRDTQVWLGNHFCPITVLLISEIELASKRLLTCK